MTDAPSPPDRASERVEAVALQAGVAEAEARLGRVRQEVYVLEHRVADERRRAEAAEAEAKRLRETLGRIERGHAANAERLDRCLAQPQWKPSRAHIEGARSAFRDTALIASMSRQQDRAALRETEREDAK